MLGLIVTALRGSFGTKRSWKSPKFLPKGMYKGRGVHNIGKINSRGIFKVNPNKVYQFVVPDLSDTMLKPYVSRSVPKPDTPKKLERIMKWSEAPSTTAAPKASTETAKK